MLNPEAPFDAMLPHHIASKAEDVGVAKARLGVLPTLLLAVLAGAFISLGAVFSTVVLTGGGHSGLVRAAAGVAFSLGLVLVVVAGAELFTGNNLLVMAFASGKISLRALLRNWSLVYIGNFVGAAATALGMFLAGFHTMLGGEIARTTLSIGAAKCELSWDVAFFRGVYCNALVCLAVWLCMSCRTSGEKILAIVLPVAAFVAAGFEHSIANMYFLPSAIFVQQFASPEWLSAHGLDTTTVPTLSLAKCLFANLVPVTLGNILGGGVLVGGIYWTIYCRKLPA